MVVGRRRAFTGAPFGFSDVRGGRQNGCMSVTRTDPALFKQVARVVAAIVATKNWPPNLAFEKMCQNIAEALRQVDPNLRDAVIDVVCASKPEEGAAMRISDAAKHISKATQMPGTVGDIRASLPVTGSPTPRDDD
jgi:hypothetical protein